MADNNNHNHGDHDHQHEHQQPEPYYNQESNLTVQSRASQSRHCFLDHENLDDNNSSSTSSHNERRVVMRKLQTAITICGTFLLVEVIGGYVAGSLAIWSDAAHLTADLAAFGVAILAAHIGSTYPASEYHTYGLKRVESLAALFSSTSLAFLSIGLAGEAVRRLILGSHHIGNMMNGWDATSNNSNSNDNDGGGVNGRLMSVIAFIGVLVNIALAWVLGEHHAHLPSDSSTHDSHDHSHSHQHHLNSNTGSHIEDSKSRDDYHSHSESHDETINPIDSLHQQDHPTTTESTPLVSPNKNSTSGTGWKVPFLPQNINLQAAYLHVMGDLTQSAAVLVAGLIIWIRPGWTAIDPICTLFFCFLVLYSTFGVIRAATAVLLQQVPVHLDWNRVRERIEAVPGVRNVHELHIWSISHSVPALTVHCTVLNNSNNNNTNNNDSNMKNSDAVLEELYALISREFGIIHATIQIQGTDGDCITCSDRLHRPNIAEASMLAVEGGDV